MKQKEDTAVSKRKKYSREPSRKLLAMKPGDRVEFPLPDKQPERRRAYRLVNSLANRILGAGNYKIRAEFGSPRCWLERLR